METKDRVQRKVDRGSLLIEPFWNGNLKDGERHTEYAYYLLLEPFGMETQVRTSPDFSPHKATHP